MPGIVLERIIGRFPNEPIEVLGYQVLWEEFDPQLDRVEPVALEKLTLDKSFEEFADKAVYTPSFLSSMNFGIQFERSNRLSISRPKVEKCILIGTLVVPELKLIGDNVEFAISRHGSPGEEYYGFKSVAQLNIID